MPEDKKPKGVIENITRNRKVNVDVKFSIHDDKNNADIIESLLRANRGAEPPDPTSKFNWKDYF